MISLGKRGKGVRWLVVFAVFALFIWASISVILFPATSNIINEPGPLQLWSTSTNDNGSNNWSNSSNSSYGPAKIRRVAVFGERGSKARFVRDMMLSVFDLSLAVEYGAETHFFGGPKFLNRSTSTIEDDDVLFVGVVREPIDWILAIAEDKAALFSLRGNEQWEDILFSEWRPGAVAGYYRNDDNVARWLQENQLFRNLFELHAYEGLILSEELPKAVKHYTLVRYEDVVGEAGAESIMQKLQERLNLEWRKGR